MTAPNSLETKGNLRDRPLAELILEIIQAGLSGSLRVATDDRKAVIYFSSGAVVYAVSNAKAHRLFSFLLERGKLEAASLSKYPNFAVDAELAAALRRDGAFNAEEIDRLIVEQMETVIVGALGWKDGEWAFSPLARAREDLVRIIDIFKLLINFARGLPAQSASHTFKCGTEKFHTSPDPPAHPDLRPHEAFTLSRFEDRPLKIEELRAMSGLPENEMLKSLNVLWLGGLVVRTGWHAAFSEERLQELLAAKVSKVKTAARPEIKRVVETPSVKDTVPEKPVPAAPVCAIKISLEEYLKQVEAAETLYDVLGLDEKAEVPAIKQAYFARAKLFHPDRFHREAPELLRRIQTAFTSLAQAYETLKSKESRESYDYKIRKELEARENARAAGHVDGPTSADRSAERGLESFEKGLLMLAEGEYETAAVHLARAVHYNPQNALYHAYYGKALAADPEQRHKAESEMQAGARLDPRNAKIRLMLVEFFIEMKMNKRAEGELRRFLEIAPGNKEAATLLEKLAPAEVAPSPR